MTQQKRQDLQGLRGLAITAVLLFHFIPTIFKNGYVGVDQFFILSGYLMSIILSRETNFSISVLFSFYYHRMKRLLPLYALFIFITLIAALTIFPAKTFKYNTVYAVKSLLFVSNFREDATQTYERMVADAKILFTHTWSLSVEIQFYVMAPFMILCSLWMISTVYSVFLGVMYCCSYFFFNYFFFWADAEDLAFNSVFTRIWQFSLGIICAHYTRPSCDKKDKERLLEENAENETVEAEPKLSSLLSNILLLSIVLLVIYPMEISSGLVRILVCLQTAGLIIVGTRLPNWFLSQRPLVYLGDISYSLYLVHWPVYVYFSHMEINPVYGLNAGVLISVLAAVILTEFYEKFYLGLDRRSIILLCSILYAASFAIIIVFSSPKLSIEELALERDFRVPQNLTKELAMVMNVKFTEQDGLKLTVPECNYKNEKTWSLCTVKNDQLTGNKTMLIIGNSYANNMARMIFRNEECTKKAKDMYLYGRPSCEVLEDSVLYGYEWCKGRNAVFLNEVHEHRPDYLFILTRHLTTMMNPLPVSEELLFEDATRRLLNMEQFVAEKIFVLNALPRPFSDLSDRVNKGLKRGAMVEENSLIDVSADFSFSRNFTANLVKSCSKCELIDILPVFMKNGQFNVYNNTNGLLYFTDGLHLTDYGLETVKPMFSKVCKTM